MMHRSVISVAKNERLGQLRSETKIIGNLPPGNNKFDLQTLYENLW